MKLAIIKEKAANETRVAASADTVKALIALGLTVNVQKSAGESSYITDKDYKDAGAHILDSAEEAIKDADIVLKVQPPTATEITQIKRGAIVAGLLANDLTATTIKKYITAKITTFSLEFMPRITRAQNMDVLSSQSNLSGYKAVIDAVHHFEGVLPMMMTAAGTIRPAKVMILGAGVAGLQAIATAKRLGAVVSAFDVRPEVKEQVESLGAQFVEVDQLTNEESTQPSVYAKETSDEYKKKQSELIHKTAQEQDIIICTALIPGKPAPKLLDDKTLKTMKAGSVVVDLATSTGGNCAWSQKNKVVKKNGITILGHENMAGCVAKEASKLYAKNLLNFIQPMIETKLKRIRIPFEDEVIQATLLTHEGKVVHQSLVSKVKLAEPPKENVSKPTTQAKPSVATKQKTVTTPAKKETTEKPLPKTPDNQTNDVKEKQSEEKTNDND